MLQIIFSSFKRISSWYKPHLLKIFVHWLVIVETFYELVHYLSKNVLFSLQIISCRLQHFSTNPYSNRAMNFIVMNFFILFDIESLQKSEFRSKNMFEKFSPASYNELGISIQSDITKLVESFWLECHCSTVVFSII